MNWILACVFLWISGSPAPGASGGSGDLGGSGNPGDSGNLQGLVDKLPSCKSLDCEAVKGLVKEGPKAWTALKPALASPDEMTRFWSLGVLSLLEIEDAFEDIVAALSDPKVRVRAGAAYALAYQKTDKVLEPLLSALSDEDVNVRLEAVDALGKRPNPKAALPLSRLLDEKDEDVRGSVCDALGQIGLSDVAAPLVERVLYDRVPMVRGRCAIALGQIQGGQEKELQKQARLERNEEAKSAILWALGESQNKASWEASLEAIAPFLTSSSELIKKHAEEAKASLEKKLEKARKPQND